jgi:hypothetical protein
MGCPKDVEKLCSNVTFHCPNCGYILLHKSVDHMGVVGTKCVNSHCRKVSNFIYTKGRFKLLTRKLLNTLDEGEFLPYSKSDILKLTVG